MRELQEFLGQIRRRGGVRDAPILRRPVVRVDVVVLMVQGAVQQAPAQAAFCEVGGYEGGEFNVVV